MSTVTREFKLTRLPKSKGGVRYEHTDDSGDVQMTVYIPQELCKHIGGGSFPKAIHISMEETKGE